jgi:nicotinamide mononucleotide transporter
MQALLSILEVLGVVTALVYLVLVTKRRWHAWPFYIASSCLYVPVFWYADLYADAALQIYFVAMGVYAWVAWKGEAAQVAVASWPRRYHVAMCLGILVVAAGLGSLLSLTSAGWFGYADALITVASVAATYITARKVLQGWLYWIAIDIAAVLVFGLRGLEATAWLYGVYAVLAWRALLAWRGALGEQGVALVKGGYQGAL